MFVKLTKISDDRFNGNHPNNIQEGHTITGIPTELKPVIGHRYIVTSSTRFVSTSLVIEIVNKSTFKTENSTYRIEKIK